MPYRMSMINDLRDYVLRGEDDNNEVWIPYTTEQIITEIEKSLTESIPKDERGYKNDTVWIAQSKGGNESCGIVDPLYNSDNITNVFARGGNIRIAVLKFHKYLAGIKSPTVKTGNIKPIDLIGTVYMNLFHPFSHLLPLELKNKIRNPSLRRVANDIINSFKDVEGVTSVMIIYPISENHPIIL